MKVVVLSLRFAKNRKRAEELYTQFIDNIRGQVKYLSDWDYTSAIQNIRQFEVPLYNRGLICYRKGFFKDVESDFRRALELKHNFKDAKKSLRQTFGQ
ncbi:tetratricopeptide repeat protein 32-like [Xyrauchen texanus]|uniref:tetratricopeptide repeat protein 32-like n=1 Tax=Xyrauchen texanus TaxID=154827 RepID=UPI00224259F1|nr:tetratricopeptide repeat protein 32-like [Xyrauchen texanus]